MSRFESYRMFITPLSPIHIGTGESYEPTNYVIEDGVLYEFDTGSVVDALSASDRKVLLDIANRKPDTDMIKAVQRYFHDRREQIMPCATNRIPVLSGVAKLYASRIGQTVNREADGKQVLNRMEIDRTSYNPITRLPVLYGSSLKGAIRTALLDGVNDGMGLQKVEDRRTGRPRNENNLELQQRLFRYQAGKFELDPMRLTQLSDAAWHEESGLPAAQIHVAVNRKKNEVKDKQGNIRKSQAESKELYQILECISGWRYRAFAGQVNVQSVDGLSETSHKGQRQLPANDLRFKIEDIARACNAFYMPILEAENKLMRERGYLDSAWDKAVRALMTIARASVQRGEAFLLRVGRHSGADSITLRGVRDIKIMKSKDEKPEYAESAKTLWLAADIKDQSTNLLPFGWLLVELQPVDTSIQEWPELKAACEPHLASARALAAKLVEKQVKFEQMRIGAEVKRREEAEKIRLRAEEEARLAREEAGRQARLATLTPEMQAVEVFREFYLVQKQKGRYQAGSAFDQKRLEFFKQTLEWNDKAARNVAAILLRETIKDWTDWPSKKERKVEFRSWLEMLEQ